MKFTTHLLARIRKALLAYLITCALMLLTAAVLFYLESYMLHLINFTWKGPLDGLYWSLALTELLLGAWGMYFWLPRRIGNKSFREIYSGESLNEFHSYRLAVVNGLFLGLSFSGFWKVILLLGYILVGVR